jgi:hypothetical protein
MRRSLGHLLEQGLKAEDPRAADLIRRMRPAKRRGYLRKDEFLDICRWKSPRSLPLCRTNPGWRVRYFTERAFASRSERARFAALTALRGVGPPTASAILTIVDPKRYGVIDIRVWRLLAELGAVRSNPRGVGFTFNQWYDYLATLRYHAREMKVSVRTIEYTLFWYHQERQVGRLYGPPDTELRP